MLARLRPCLWLSLVYLSICGGLRSVLFWRFAAAADIGWLSLPAVLVAGIVNDSVVAMVLMTPLALWQLLRAQHKPSAARIGLPVLVGVFTAITVYLAASEYFFFDEFNARFNIVAFDYLVYPTEVAGDLWAEYPVIKVLFAAAAVGATVAFWWRSKQVKIADLPHRIARHRLSAALAWLGCLAIVLSLHSTDSLSLWRNRVKNELLQNGWSSFVLAARTSEIDYAAYYVTANRELNTRLLEAALSQDGGTLISPGQSLQRAYPARPEGLGRMNIVVVSSEAFGAEFSQAHGGTKNLTPQLDALTTQSLWFPHTYASGTRTVRGLEAIAASFPPIPTVSILRRPGNEGVANWGELMRGLGYDTSFIYGGFSYFDNMRHFFSANGFAVVDRQDMVQPRFTNIWGASDEDLFDLAADHFDGRHKAGKPFFSIIMTTSNHKPFTFRPGLEHLGIAPEGGGRAAGVRYADYALGYFLESARKHAWFDNTVFVVVADHGARVYGKADIPLRTFEIPLLIYAPTKIAPQRVETMATQIDVAPTVMGLLGLPYRAPFFGQDLLRVSPAHRIALFNHNHDVAIFRDNEIAVFGLNRRVSFFRYDRDSDKYTPQSANPTLQALGIAYFQTAAEQFRDHRYVLEK
jgi:phosphoglycerol transferase MdoB-like AlkP superfamily enzyme